MKNKKSIQEWQDLLGNIKDGKVQSLSRAISLVENEYNSFEEFLSSLPTTATKIIGVTGPPGAGKSTLVDAMISEFCARGKRVGVLCVDPSSPFNLGAVLGDRIRMSEWYTNPNVFIRSLATRGSMGGLHPRIIEITDVMKSFPFDHIIVETVGVGQSEIEIAGLADVTVVVLVPEAGDEVQTMKAGLMEIADVFVVNKADRPGADLFVKNLNLMLAPAFRSHYQEVPVVKTVAVKREGVAELVNTVMHQLQKSHLTDKRFWLLAERAFHLIQQYRMKDVKKDGLKEQIQSEYPKGNFNLYRFVSHYLKD